MQGFDETFTVFRMNQFEKILSCATGAEFRIEPYDSGAVLRTVDIVGSGIPLKAERFASLQRGLQARFTLPQGFFRLLPFGDLHTVSADAAGGRHKTK